MMYEQTLDNTENSLPGAQHHIGVHDFHVTSDMAGWPHNLARLSRCDCLTFFPGLSVSTIKFNFS